MKKKKRITRKTDDKILLAFDLAENDSLVLAYEKELRLVVSDKKEEMKEPWYIITNDTESTREDTVKIYYLRFEIEEFFRDAKRLLGLEQVNFKKENSLAVVLWFVLSGCWFASELEEKMSDEEKKEREIFRLSSIRYFF